MGISWFLSHHLRRAWHAYDRAKRITAAASNNVHRLTGADTDETVYPLHTDEGTMQFTPCRHRRNSLPGADTYEGTRQFTPCRHRRSSLPGADTYEGTRQFTLCRHRRCSQFTPYSHRRGSKYLFRVGYISSARIPVLRRFPRFHLVPLPGCVIFLTWFIHRSLSKPIHCKRSYPLHCIPPCTVTLLGT